ncbi:MAG TPA: CatA-like O-acetyltransferase [Herpetosiphonaceae bacterium]
MRTIDMASWPRRKHFEIYHRLTYPHFSLCAAVDVTALYGACKQRGLSFNISATYLLARAANLLAPFRLRIRGDSVVEHEAVHPSPTVLTDGDLFSFCSITYDPSYAAFAALAAERIAAVKAQIVLEDGPGQDDLLFMTSIPWVSFTSMQHPVHLNPIDSVPRIAWGKFRFEEGARMMPLAVQVHHALMDGVHVGRYYELAQELLDHPQEVLDS